MYVLSRKWQVQKMLIWIILPSTYQQNATNGKCKANLECLGIKMHVDIKIEKMKRRSLPSSGIFGQITPGWNSRIMEKEKPGEGNELLMIWSVPYYLLNMVEAVLWQWHVWLPEELRHWHWAVLYVHVPPNSAKLIRQCFTVKLLTWKDCHFRFLYLYL